MARIVETDGEAQLAAQRGKAFDTCFCLVAEAKVFAFVKLLNMQRVAKNGGDELARGVACKFRRKGEDEQRVESRGGEQTDLFRKRRDERLARFGADDAGRMRVEGDGDGCDAECARAGDDLGDNPLVAAMYAVEVADSGDGGAEVRGHVCEFAIELHQAISNWS